MIQNLEKPGPVCTKRPHLTLLIHQLIYSLLDEYTPTNLEILSRDFVFSQISSNCSNDGFGDTSAGVATVIFHRLIVASKDTYAGSTYNAS